MKNNLPALRAQRGMTQGDLADALNVSRQTINALETERYDPSLPLAFAIAKLFKCRIEDVLGKPFWSTPEQFTARQQTATSKTISSSLMAVASRNLLARRCSHSAA